ncbi:hypothetical protein [Capybara microvirus Cap1_SP_81]|nr:hypothetical protein [Capybara microvirus Cap1_SP_81]
MAKKKKQDEESNVIWLENGMHLVQEEQTQLYAICYGKWRLTEPRHIAEDAKKLALSIAPSMEHLEILLNLVCMAVVAREQAKNNINN